MSRRLTLFSLSAVAATAVAVLLGAGITTTSAQWTDDARFSAGADVGSWPPASGLGTCELLDASGAPVPGASCTVSSITLIEQGGLNAGQLLREYEVATATSSTDPTDQVSFRVDLSAPEVIYGGQPVNPSWSWNDASTSPEISYTPIAGYTCGSLPLVNGVSTAGVSGPVRVTVHDHPVADQTCAG
ncbi:hypothetical protein WJX64_05245 [Leifsonia sp. YIM 134122]|uniref:Secreted protein n=1 Tax=Leifsonia stereocauli TaxID=3134136 RepID=A0ABU9W1S9_9MICO